MAPNNRIWLAGLAMAFAFACSSDYESSPSDMGAADTGTGSQTDSSSADTGAASDTGQDDSGAMADTAADTAEPDTAEPDTGVDTDVNPEETQTMAAIEQLRWVLQHINLGAPLTEEEFTERFSSHWSLEQLQSAFRALHHRTGGLLLDGHEYEFEAPNRLNALVGSEDGPPWRVIMEVEEEPPYLIRGLGFRIADDLDPDQQGPPGERELRVGIIGVDGDLERRRLEGATVQLLDRTTGEPLISEGAAGVTNAFGFVSLEVPGDVDGVALFVEAPDDEYNTLIYDSALITQQPTIWYNASSTSRAMELADSAEVDYTPGDAILLTQLLYTPLWQPPYTQIGCATITMEPEGPSFAYALNDPERGYLANPNLTMTDPSASTGWSFGVPEGPRQVVVTLNGEEITYDLPRVPAGTMTALVAREPFSSAPQNPTPHSCFTPVVDEGCGSESERASESAPRGSILTVDNQTDQRVDFKWVNFEGVIEDRLTLSPGEWQHIQTGVGHRWIALGEDGECLGSYTAVEGVGRVLIER